MHRPPASVAGLGGDIGQPPGPHSHDGVSPGIPGAVAEALDAVAAETAIQSVLFIAGSLASRAAEISNVILGLVERTDKPVFVCWPRRPAESGSGSPRREYSCFWTRNVRFASLAGCIRAPHPGTPATPG